MKTIRENLIDEFMRHCSDIIPYDLPNYEEKLLEYAEAYADQEINKEYISLCEEHDKLLEEGIILW